MLSADPAREVPRAYPNLTAKYVYLLYVHHHNPILIANCSWLLTIHKDRIFWKKSSWKQRNVLQNGVKLTHVRYLLYCKQLKGFLGLARNISFQHPRILKGLGSTLKLRHISHPLKVKLPLGTWYEDTHYTYEFPYILDKVGCFSNWNSAVICLFPALECHQNYPRI